MPMKEIKTSSVSNLEISDDIESIGISSICGSIDAGIYYLCEFSYEGKPYEGVIEAVRVWDEGEQYASVEWASDTINNVEEK